MTKISTFGILCLSLILSSSACFSRAVCPASDLNSLQSCTQKAQNTVIDDWFSEQFSYQQQAHQTILLQDSKVVSVDVSHLSNFFIQDTENLENVIIDDLVYSAIDNSSKLRNIEAIFYPNQTQNTFAEERGSCRDNRFLFRLKNLPALETLTLRVRESDGLSGLVAIELFSPVHASFTVEDRIQINELKFLIDDATTLDTLTKFGAFGMLRILEGDPEAPIVKEYANWLEDSGFTGDFIVCPNPTEEVYPGCKMIFDGPQNVREACSYTLDTDLSSTND